MGQVYQKILSTKNFEPPAFPIIKKGKNSEPIIKEELTEEEEKEIKQDTILDEKSTIFRDKNKWNKGWSH